MKVLHNELSKNCVVILIEIDRLLNTLANAKEKTNFSVVSRREETLKFLR